MAYPSAMDTKTIIQTAGGPSAVAKLFGITSQAVSQWEVIPADRCIPIEIATCGLVSRYQMRPDVFGEKVA